MVTKQQMVNGLIRFIEDEVIAKVDDRPVRIMLAVAVNALRSNPSMIDAVLNNDIISTAMPSNDGMYDIVPITQILKETLIKYGEFPITIPPIKFISPTEKVLKFSADDVAKLEKYIGENDLTTQAVNTGTVA